MNQIHSPKNHDDVKDDTNFDLELPNDSRQFDKIFKVFSHLVM